MNLNNSWFKAFLLLIATALLFFYPLVLNPGKMIYSANSDVVAPFTGYKILFTESVSKGVLPLWNPLEYSGSPFVGNIQSTMFYPFFLLFLILPFFQTFGFLFILAVFLAGFFTFLLARKLGLSSKAALVSALAFMLGGVFVGRIASNQFLGISTIAWIPLVFLALEFLLEQREFRKLLLHSVLLAVSLALMFLAGQTQYFAYTFFSLILYFIFRIAINYFEFAGKKAKKESKALLLDFLKPAIAFAIGLFVFFLIVSVQLLPSLLLSSEFYRSGGVSFKFATDFYSFPPEQIVTFVFPEFFGTSFNSSYQGEGNFWEACVYIGLIPLFFALFSLKVVLKKKAALFFAFLGVFSFLFAMGKYTPLFGLLFEYVPFFDLFRVPEKMLALTGFSLALLAGFGFDSFIESLGKNAKKQMKIVLALSALLLIALFAFLVFKQQIISLGQKIVEARFAVHAGPEFGIKYYLDIVEVLYNSMLENIAQAFAFVALFTAGVFLLAWKKIGLEKLSALIIVLVFLNLFLFGAKYVQVASPQEVFAQNSLSLFLKANLSTEERVLDLNNSFFQNYSTYNGIHSAFGYDPVPLRDYIELVYLTDGFFVSKLDKGEYPPNIESLCSDGRKCNLKILDILNVKYVIATSQISDPQLKLVFQDLVYYPNEKIKRQVFVFENLHVLPKAFFASDAFVLPSKQAVEERLLSDSFNPRQEVIIESSEPLQQASPAGIFEGLTFERKNANQVLVHSDLKEDGFVFLSEAYSKGWKAFVDGREAKVFKADYALMAVQASRGKHEVLFSYEPDSLSAGLTLSLIGVLFALAVLFYSLYQKPSGSKRI